MLTNHKKIYLVNIYHNLSITITQSDSQLFDHFEISLANPLTTPLHLIASKTLNAFKWLLYKELALESGLNLET